MDLGAIQPQLEACFAGRPVVLAYLFGSHAAGSARRDSDVDVAVLLADSLSIEQRYAERLGLIGALMRLLGTDDVDVTVLNEAPVSLAMAVLRSGDLLYCAGTRERVEYQVRITREYDDTRSGRRILRDAMHSRIRTGRFGKLPRPPTLRQLR